MFVSFPNKKLQMKFFTLKVFVVLIAIAVIFFSNKRADKDRNFFQNETMEPEGGEEGDAAKWELKRLADPSGQIPYHIREREIAFASTLPSDAGMRNVQFVNRGPWNVGGRTRSFAMDVSDTNTLIAGSTAGDIWRSTDGGANWTMVTDGTTPFGVSCLVQDKRPGHTQTWYAGTGEAYGQSASGNGSNSYYLGHGMLKSTDNGQTWTRISSTLSSSVTGFDLAWDLVWNVATDVSNDTADVVYAAVYGTIYRSVDGGNSWTAVLAGTSSNYSYFTDVQVTTTGVVYATMSDDGPHKGIWRSADGINFTNILPDSFPLAYNRIVMGFNPQNENEVYFLGNTPNYGLPDTNFLGDIEWNSLWKYTYVSGDGNDTGGVWENRSRYMPNNGGPFDKFNCQGSYDLVVKVKPDDSNTVFIGGTNIFRSTTAFADSLHTRFIGGYKEGTTLPIVKGYPNHHPDQHVLFFHPNHPDVLYSANDGGLFRTNNNMEDTVHWQTFNHGYLTSMFYTCAIDPATANDNIIIGGAQDNGSWWTNNTNQTTPWVSPRGGDGSFCAIADGKTSYYFSIQNGKTMRAKVSNATGAIDSFSRIDPLGKHDYIFINPFMLDPTDNDKMYFACDNKLYRNNSLSGIGYLQNWDSISTNWMIFPDTLASTRLVTAFGCTVNPTPHILYYGTDSKRIYKVMNADTGNPTRTDVTPLLFPSAYINCIAVDPHDGNKVVVVFSNYGVHSIWFTEDGGTSWKKGAGNLEMNAGSTGDGPSVRWVSILHLPDGNTAYFAATSVGLFATDKLIADSTVWVKQSENTIGNSVCDMIVSRESDGLVVVATHSRGIFSANITSINDIVTVRDLKAKSVVASVYPNPSSSVSTFEINLPQQCNGNISVYDLTGRKLTTVFAGNFSEGENKFQLKTSEFSAGVYFIVFHSKYFEKATPLLVAH